MAVPGGRVIGVPCADGVIRTTSRSPSRMTERKARTKTTDLSEAEIDAAGGGEENLHGATRGCESVAGPGTGGDPLAFAEAASAGGAFVSEPGEETEKIPGGVGAGALDADDSVDGE